MDKRVIDLHDEALLLRPQDAAHDRDACPICLDWAMDPMGVPVSFEKMDDAARKAPWGDVEYADEGLIDGVKRYPLDTEAHVHWSRSYITSPEVAKNYSSEQLERVSSRISKAALELQGDAAKGDIDNRTPEGVMDTITKETHEALLQKAVDDATAQLREEKARLESQVSDLASQHDQASERAGELETEVSRLEGELDTAQVKLKTVEDEVSSLREDIASRDKAMALKEKSEKRADEVRGLGLFPDEHISEKAERWAKYSDEEFASLLEDWKAARDASKSEGSVETASRFSGSSEGAGTKTEGAVSARRAVLGL